MEGFSSELTGFLNRIKKTGEEGLSIHELKITANIARQYIIEMVYKAKSGHPGGPLGLADIYTWLYFNRLKMNLADPMSNDRDRLLLSNGHVCAVKYSLLALRGILKEDELWTFRKLGSRLQGHPSTKYLPLLENSSGSLGQGLSNAGGVATGLKMQKNPSRVFVGMSDGECQEGMTWEAAMAIAHRKLDNITAFIDWNNIQIDGHVSDVMSLGNFPDKFRSFGWNVIEAQGHDFSSISEAFNGADKSEKPAVILFHTTLGKGVDFMENNSDWHGSPPDTEKRDNALKQLRNSLDIIMKDVVKV